MWYVKKGILSILPTDLELPLLDQEIRLMSRPVRWRFISRAPCPILHEKVEEEFLPAGDPEVAKKIFGWLDWNSLCQLEFDGFGWSIHIEVQKVVIGSRRIEVIHSVWEKGFHNLGGPAHEVHDVSSIRTLIQVAEMKTDEDLPVLSQRAVLAHWHVLGKHLPHFEEAPQNESGILEYINQYGLSDEILVLCRARQWLSDDILRKLEQGLLAIQSTGR